VRIAVDVGNSHLSFSTRTSGGLSTVSVAWSANARTFHLGDTDSPLDLGAYLQQSLFASIHAVKPTLSDGQTGDPCSWWISSVNPPATEQLRFVLQQLWPEDAVFEINQSMIPLDDDLENRHKTGVDRLLAAWFASRYGETKQTATEPSARGVIVVDAGSAVTVDWVDGAGVFRGGMIYPGFRLAANSLHRDTAALPLLTEFKCTTPPTAAGRATAPAIEAGLFWSQWGGLCGAVEALQRHACQSELTVGSDAEHFGQPRVIVTGGGIRAFESLLPSHWHWEPQLLPQAILKLADEMRSEALNGRG
jgi:type III pantothenate kinase